MAAHGAASEAAGRVVVMCLPLPNLSALIHPFSGLISRSASHGGLRQKERKKKILFSLPSLIFSDAISALHSPRAPHRQRPVSSVVSLTLASTAALLRPRVAVRGEKGQLRLAQGGRVVWRQCNRLKISMQSMS